MIALAALLETRRIKERRNAVTKRQHTVELGGGISGGRVFALDVLPYKG